MKLKFTYRPRIKNSVAQKTLSRLLAFGVLINSISINSYAGILSEDTRYETFSGNYITVNDILEEDKVNIKIEGNTLVNLANGEYNKVGDANPESELIDNVYSVTATASGSLVAHKGAILKNNTKYTLICEINTNLKRLSYSFKNNENFTQGVITENIDYSDGYSQVIKVITTTSDCTDVAIGNHTYNNSIDSYLNIKNLMLFEGDLTDNPPTEYIEGLKSSFEDQLVTQEMVDSGEEKAKNLGKYKVDVKTTGKNKLNINMTETITANGVTINYNDDKTITLNGVATNAFPISITTEEIKYDMSKKYIACINVISGSCTGYTDGESWGLLFYPQDGFNPKIDSSSSYATKFYPNTESYKPYLWLGYDDNAETSSTFDNFTFSLQIVESSVKDTSYEPYKEYINTFYLNSPLLEGDTIEYINGQATHVKRSDEVIIDGSRYIQSEETAVENKFRWNLYHSPSVDNILNTHIVTLNSDRYKCISSNETWFCTNEGLAQNNIGHNIYLYLEKYSDGSNTSKESLLNELKSNPTKIIYQLASPIYEPINADLSAQLFEGATHISNNSTIPTTMEITVDRTINRAVEAIELAKINPTISNISKARMWTNLLDDSIKKDELQNEINDITDIEDLQLERKTATSNIDVYIKSQNMLLMSLSTNSITFEDFSGIEDIVKENAINISINSSLPYNLSAYLATEIQNSDGTNIMNKDIFSIKESSELNYQTFSDVNNKLILKENCRSGNNQKHNIDLKLNGGIAHEKDVYKTVIKFEAEQQ